MLHFVTAGNSDKWINCKACRSMSKGWHNIAYVYKNTFLCHDILLDKDNNPSENTIQILCHTFQIFIIYL